MPVHPTTTVLCSVRATQETGRAESEPAMLGRRRDRGSSLSKPHAEDAALAGGAAIFTGGGQEVTVSQFVAQLDEAARKRLDRMNQRLRLLEQQMETLEAEVGKASSSTTGTYE